jgi:hypothetical protein
MNAKTVFAVAAFAALASAAARADDITIDTTPFHSQLTRAEVQADLLQFKQGGVNPWSTSYDPLKYYQPTLTRDQVRAEYLSSRNEVTAMNGEDSGSAYLTQMAASNSHNGSTNLAAKPMDMH